MDKKYIGNIRSERRSWVHCAGILIYVLSGCMYPLIAQITTTSKSGTAQQSAEGERTLTPSTLVNRINESQLVGLPLNGRSYNQLVTLQAGVSDTSAVSSSRGTGGQGGLTISGSRSTSNNFLLDGTNVMDTNNRVPSSAAGVQLGSDTILQIQVFSVNYGVEYGRGSGGILNSITRSGTQEFHGSFFEFFRNSNLDARNYFDPGSEPTPFKRNQFGFTITGPIRKDKTFFMVGFEALRDRLTQNDFNFLPDKDAREGRITDASGKVLRTVPVSPLVKPYLDLFPVPNSTRRGQGIAENLAVVALPTDEDFFTARVDHQISTKNSAFLRYKFDDAATFNPDQLYIFRRSNASRQQYLTLLDTHIINLSVLNSFRVSYTRPVSTNLSLSSIDIPRSLFFVPDSPYFGQIDVSGLTLFGPNDVPPEVNVMNSFQFADDLLINRGTHMLKLGVDVHRYRWDVSSGQFKGGSWSFNSLESFLQGGPGGTTLTVSLPGSDNREAYRQTLAGVYFQDDYKIAANLSAILGIRYEYSTLIRDKNGKTAYVTDPIRDSSAIVGPLLKENPSLRNLSPRLGIRWSPLNNQKMMISAGFGIYYDHLMEYVIDPAKSTVPFYKKVVKTNFDSSAGFPNSPTFPDSPGFPDAVGVATGLPLQAQILDYHHITNPMILRYNITVAQELPGGLDLQASYVGARGNHLFRTYEANLFPVPTEVGGALFFPPNSGPINPAFGSILLTTSDAQSFYNAFQLSGSKNVGGKMSLQANYTYSKSVDDASSNSRSAQYGWMRTLERGRSDFDIRRRLVISTLYSLPRGSNLIASVLGGWRVGGIFTFRTGTPFTPQSGVRTPGYLFAANRPNLLPGRSKNPIEGFTEGCEGVSAGQSLGTPQRYFDPCVYAAPAPGTLGNAGRNTITSPSIVNLDVSLRREFAVDTKRRFEFRADFFNLLNHTNFSGSQGGATILFTGASGSRNPTAGRIRGTATTSRQIQFALRFSF